MPEIPNVVPGEPVEADWGNDIRDRSVQKYADLTALEASQPVPQLGELAWLTNPGYLVVCTDAAGPTWTPLLDRTDGDGRWVLKAGDTMTGALTATKLTSSSDLELSGTFINKLTAGTFAVRIDGKNVLTLQGARTVARAEFSQGAALDPPKADVLPWTTQALTIGELGALGTMGAFFAGLYGNWMRTSASQAVSLGANGQNGAGTVEIDPTGVVKIAAVNTLSPGTKPADVVQVTQGKLAVLNGELTLSGGGTQKVRYTAADAAVSASRDAVWVSTGVGSNYRLFTIATLADADPVVADFFTDSPAAAALVDGHSDEGPTHRDIIQALVHEVTDLRARIEALEGA